MSLPFKPFKMGEYTVAQLFMYSCFHVCISIILTRRFTHQGTKTMTDDVMFTLVLLVYQVHEYLLINYSYNVKEEKNSKYCRVLSWY